MPSVLHDLDDRPIRASSARRLALCAAACLASPVLAAQPPAAAAGDPLAELVRWPTVPAASPAGAGRTPSTRRTAPAGGGAAAGDGPHALVTLPSALAAAVARAVPGWRVVHEDESLYGHPRGAPGVSWRAVARDLDSDGRLEAVLLGVIPSARGAAVGAAARTAGPATRTVAVLGVRTTAAGSFVVDVLHRAEEVTGAPHVDPDHPDGQWAGGLSVQRLTPAGTEPAPGARARTTVVWVRYQDPDCRETGWQWTVRGGRWVRTSSACSGGD